MPPFVKPRHDAAAAIVERSRMRAGLVARAEQVVGAGAKLDAVDDLALMRLVIKAAEPGLAAKCDAGSEGYLRELYRIVLEDERSKPRR